jgi:hypothetical protein
MAFMPHVNASVREARQAGLKRGSQYRLPFLARDAEVLVPLVIVAVLVVPWVVGALQIAGWLMH